MGITYYSRKTKRIEEEKVLGSQFIDWAYGTYLGRMVTETLGVKSFVSRIFGAFEDHPRSAKKIESFVRDYEIPMHEFEDVAYPTFNDFFIRKFKDGMRPFPNASDEIGSGADARYFLIQNLGEDEKFSVKGFHLRLESLFQNKTWAETFRGADVLIARLCPVDYHRFHVITDSKLIHHKRVGGVLHSVNPKALEVYPDIFLKNERQISHFESQALGEYLMIEVGALGVGKIIQSHPMIPGHFFEKGQEKGYFLFGGSTVIWVFKPNVITWESDLIEHSKKGIETWIPLGGILGRTQKNG